MVKTKNMTSSEEFPSELEGWKFYEGWEKKIKNIRPHIYKVVHPLGYVLGCN